MKYSYDCLDDNGNDEVITMSEEEILDVYWEYWKGSMEVAVTKKNTVAYNKPEMITKENCIENWVIVNWAYPVKEEVDEE